MPSSISEEYFDSIFTSNWMNFYFLTYYKEIDEPYSFATFKSGETTKKELLKQFIDEVLP